MSPQVSYAYYPGCSLHASSADYDASVVAVSRVLGIELAEVPDWTCCGSTPAHNIDSRLSAALCARNLVQVRKMGRDQVTSPCPSCVANLRTADMKMAHKDFAESTNRLLDEPYTGGVTAKSFLQIVYEDIGPQALKELVRKPLAGLKVAAYYGCLTTRPTHVMAFDSEENPVSMDKLLEACGAKPLEFSFKTECCGASMAVPKKEAATTLSGKILELAELIGAEAVVVACPLCQMNLDLRRGQIAAATGQYSPLPVFYFTQLIGLALGLSKEELGIAKLCVSPAKALEKMAAKTPPPEQPERPAKEI
jgi:heterodisulfide reductase subunit B